MAKNLFVGGLPYELTQEELKNLFVPCGTVTSAKLILDRETGRSKGFGFVEMSTEDEAKAAIAKLNSSMVGGRKIFVNEARPPEKRVPGMGPRPGGPPRPGGFGGPRPSAPAGPFSDKPWDDKPGGGKGAGRKKKWGAKGEPGSGGKDAAYAAKKKWEEKRRSWDGGGDNDVGDDE